MSGQIKLGSGTHLSAWAVAVATAPVRTSPRNSLRIMVVLLCCGALERGGRKAVRPALCCELQDGRLRPGRVSRPAVPAVEASEAHCTGPAARGQVNCRYAGKMMYPYIPGCP